MMRFAVLAVGLCACASGSQNREGEIDAPAQQQQVDAKQFQDAPPQHPDAAMHHPDAFVYLDAPAVVTPDAPPDACVPVSTQMLANPSFDASPVASGWNEVQFNSTQEVTNDVPQSVPYSLFLGGWTGYGTVTDQAYQDVAIPANATNVTLSGYVAVGTSELGGTWDTAQVGLIDPATSAGIEVALSVDNNTNTSGGFVTFSHSFSVGAIAGKTVRLRFTSTSDDTNNTNFFFDTLQLNVTHCP